MRISEFEASLVYRVSSRTARATQRNPVSKKQNKTKKKKKKKRKKKKKPDDTKVLLATVQRSMEHVGPGLARHAGLKACVPLATPGWEVLGLK
jgi:hypothetical protein